MVDRSGVEMVRCHSHGGDRGRGSAQMERGCGCLGQWKVEGSDAMGCWGSW